MRQLRVPSGQGKAVKWRGVNAKPVVEDVDFGTVDPYIDEGQA